MQWQKITLIGVGLLGGSLGLALKRRALAGTVTGYVRRPASITECESCGAVDSAGCDVAEAVAGAELIVLCTPLAQMLPLVRQMLPHLTPGVIVTDVGSVKGSVVRELEGIIAGAGGHFVGSHPMAGAEKMGVAAARETLFQQAICVVTPTAQSHPQAVARVEALWSSVGARLLRLSPEEHDALVSRSSHLPHVVAAELANFVLNPLHPPEQAKLCANGFRDTTRIASGSPEMWRDIAVTNRGHLSQALGVFIEDLLAFQKALEAGDEKTIETFFNQAKQRRDQWCCPSNSPE